ncbi:hypothetical protein Gogos_020712 [Gossypium gossypioides]|uniref:Uncharacterized protein n=3 Tax=Gossypium gossypioides TaxID=34282 RepID=A0A7J9D5H8_GOSGO|nr:hypothetical protein [Gossypium gossypioides]
MNKLQEDLVVRHGVGNIGIIARMSEDTQSREDNCQIASFDSNLPQIVAWTGPLANLMGLPVDTVKSRLKDKNGPCISWFDIRDAMGKASGDRRLLLFAFALYGLIAFPKALGYVSVKLADFLF